MTMVGTNQVVYCLVFLVLCMASVKARIFSKLKSACKLRRSDLASSMDSVFLSRAFVYYRGGASTTSTEAANGDWDGKGIEDPYAAAEIDDKDMDVVVAQSQTPEFMGVPRQLVPLYLAFMCDSVAIGIIAPILPFLIIQIGANAMQLSMVISSNYVAQAIGCIVMGRVSDKFGRKPVISACLFASSLSLLCVSNASSLITVALARVIVGSCGGLLAQMQSCVADIAPQEDRPKFMGRIMATFGAGFVIGPAISAVVPNLGPRDKIRLAACLPLIGLIITLTYFKECKQIKATTNTAADTEDSVATKPKEKEKISPIVLGLIFNGFLLMYAFATETIYAIFMKESFEGYGERALSTLLAASGAGIGLFQVFLIKPLINMIGKHATLVLGNVLLTCGMIGIALVRQKMPHFALFFVHIIGYSIADTALASLISRYSSSQMQGQALSLNQAAQSCARVVSPIVAGILYEKSKTSPWKNDIWLPQGALPFLFGAIMPLLALIIPVKLLMKSLNEKKQKQEETNHTL